MLLATSGVMLATGVAPCLADEVDPRSEAAPLAVACSRDVWVDPRGLGTGRAAWGVRIRDGVLVAGVASLGGAP